MGDVIEFGPRKAVPERLTPLHVTLWLDPDGRVDNLQIHEQQQPAEPEAAKEYLRDLSKIAMEFAISVEQERMRILGFPDAKFALAAMVWDTSHAWTLLGTDVVVTEEQRAWLARRLDQVKESADRISRDEHQREGDRAV